MKSFTLACALTGALGLAASAPPVSAAPLSGLKNTPAVESITIDVRKRRHHRRWHHRHHRHYYRHHYYQPYGYYYQRPYYSPFPFFFFGL